MTVNKNWNWLQARRTAHHCANGKAGEPEGPRLEDEWVGPEGVTLVWVWIDGHDGDGQVGKELDVDATTGKKPFTNEIML